MLEQMPTAAWRFHAIALGCLLAIHSQAQLANGLIAYYPFNNGNTANQAPTSFSTLFAQQTSATANASGVANQALAFSGNAPQLWVNAAGLIDFGLTTSFSFVTDFRSTSSATQNFFRDLLTNGHGWRIGFYNSTGHVSFQTGSGASAVNIRTNALFNDGAWHQVALLVDKVNLQVRIYVDNVQQELGGTVCGVDVSGAVADISGCNFNANEDNDQLTTFGEDLVGALDEIRLYGRLLTVDEVAAAHALSFGGTSGIHFLEESTITGRFDAARGVLHLAGLDPVGSNVLQVLGADGRVVSGRNVEGAEAFIPLQGLGAGAYLVTVGSARGRWSSKFVLTQ